ncbi:cell division protein FtsQ/DivIB [Plantactinospora siamensis]|uniref:Cell division protein FtsQ n=1 Tax=Plantactinospora siamensis TaxID=555372 RepID=A0ABV6NZJ9_9ACTN
MDAARRWRLVRAGNDAVPASARRFMQRARRRRLRAALPWAVLAGGLALAALIAWVVLGTGLLGVARVRVAGTGVLTAAQVSDAAAVPTGTPLARVDLAAVRRRVAALPAVRRVTVRRSWPDTVVVEVVERTPALAVPRDGGFAVLDNTGVVFQSAPLRPDGLPLARVAAPGPTDPATRAATEVFGSLPAELRQQVAEVGAPSPARITLLLRDGRTIIWGDAAQSEVKARVAASLLSRRGNTIDVSAPDVVTIR